MDSTPRSPFFAAPLEIRQHIYRMIWGAETHLFLDEGQLNIMPCQGEDDVSWRRPHSETKFNDSRWIRRVDSDWGCHWKCEEAYLDGIEQPSRACHMPLLPILLSSKMM